MKIFLLLLLIPSLSCASPKEVKILPPEDGIYHTAFSTMYSSSNNVSDKEVPYFVNLAGKKIVWLNFSNDWFNGIKFPEQSVKNIYKTGSIPSIRILPWSDYNKYDTKYSLRKIVNGEFDKELRQWAKDLKACDIPVMIDFAAEPNGDWFPWSGANNGAGNTNGYGSKTEFDGPEIWRDAYKHLFDIFKKEDVTKVTWVFHMNSIGSSPEEWNKIKNYYPGDEYVDWLGISAYGPQRWGENYIHFLDVMKPGYYDLAALSETKPIAVLEFGVADYLPQISKPNWIQDALYSVQTAEFYRIKAVGWWHSTWWNADGTMSAIQIDSSPESLRFYKEAIAQPVFVGEYKLSQ
jgi:beta-mannanase